MLKTVAKSDIPWWFSFNISDSIKVVYKVLLNLIFDYNFLNSHALLNKIKQQNLN